MSNGDVTIGAVVYPAGTGGEVDKILGRVAELLKADRLGLAGAVQYNTHDGDRCRCDMTLEDLASGKLVQISEDLGPESQGCRLNSSALEEIVGSVCATLDRGADLLIVNKFGKRESEGGGFRQPIELALAKGIPVLMAINRAQLDNWNAFADGVAEQLPLDPDKIADWCRSKSLSAQRNAEVT